MRDSVGIDRDEEADVLEAFVWYEEQAAGLGYRFVREFEACLERILDNPTGFPSVYQATRRTRLTTFPYGVYYKISDGEIRVFACVHASRSDRVWRKRLR